MPELSRNTELSRNVMPFCQESGMVEVKSPSRGKKFAGTRHGREVTVEAHRSTRTQNPGTVQTRVYDGHRLNITLSTPIMTRLVISSRAFTGNSATGVVANSVGNAAASTANTKLGASEVPGLRPEYAGMGAQATETSWATSTLNEAEVANMVSYLLADGTGSKKSKLTLGPGSSDSGTLWLMVVTTDFTPNQVGYWADSMERLLVAMEAQPAPTVRVEMSRLESAVTKNMNRTAWYLVGGIIAASFLIVGVLVGLAVLLGS